MSHNRPFLDRFAGEIRRSAAAGQDRGYLLDDGGSGAVAGAARPVDQAVGSCTTDRMFPSGSLNQAPRIPPSSAIPLTVFSPGRS
jgi:hypothetical protein